MSQYQDQIIKCIGTRENPCGKEFAFTAKDQAFYAEKEFTQPKRCKECRQEVRAFREANRRPQ